MLKIITYDISSSKDRKRFQETIEKHDFVEIGQYDYAIKTTKTVKELHDELVQCIGPSDRLLVANIMHSTSVGYSEKVLRWFNC